MDTLRKPCIVGEDPARLSSHRFAGPCHRIGLPSEAFRQTACDELRDTPPRRWCGVISSAWRPARIASNELKIGFGLDDFSCGRFAEMTINCYVSVAPSPISVRSELLAFPRAWARCQGGTRELAAVSDGQTWFWHAGAVILESAAKGRRVCGDSVRAV